MVLPTLTARLFRLKSAVRILTLYKERFLGCVKGEDSLSIEDGIPTHDGEGKRQFIMSLSIFQNRITEKKKSSIKTDDSGLIRSNRLKSRVFHCIKN